MNLYGTFYVCLKACFICIDSLAVTMTKYNTFNVSAPSAIQVRVVGYQVALFVLLMEIYILAEWRYGTPISGTLFVMMIGAQMMPELCAGNWAITVAQVLVAVLRLVREQVQYYWMTLDALDQRDLCCHAYMLACTHTTVLIVKMQEQYVSRLAP